MARKKLSTIVVVQALVLTLVSLTWAAPAAAQPRGGTGVVAGGFGSLSALANLAVERAMGWLEGIWAPTNGAVDPDGVTTSPPAPSRFCERGIVGATKRPK